MRVLRLPNRTLEDKETTFAELQARITTTISILNSIDLTTIDAKKVAEETMIMETGKMGDFKFESGQIYLSEYTILKFISI